MVPHCILVIDDDRYLRHMLQMSLIVMNDVVVRYATNGQEGIHMALDDPLPDLILLDFDMPVMDGWAALQQLRAQVRTARIPVVAMTGSHPRLPRCAEMIAASDAFLPKPFTLNALRHIVRSLLSPGQEAQ